MSFINSLMHALTEIPASSVSIPITHYLPKNVSTDNVSAMYLLYPQAAGHISMPAEIHLSFHPIPSYGILHVTQGSGVLTSGDLQYNLIGNCFAFFDCRDGFSFMASSPLEYDLLYFNGSPASCFYEELQRNNGLFLPSISSSGLGAFLRPLFPAGNQYPSSFTFHRLITDLLSELVDYSNAPASTEAAIPDYLRQLKEYLDENYFKNITLSELETLFFVNQYRICREFRSAYFMPPIQYLHLARINKAKLLLVETNLKIHEISYQVGYENTNHFIHHFKKLTGRTPAAFRERKLAN